MMDTTSQASTTPAIAARQGAGTGATVASAIGATLHAMKADMPGEDFTRIYQFQKTLREKLEGD